MPRYYLIIRDALDRLRTDRDGVVSLEYVIVAACIMGGVIAAFGTNATSGVGAALTSALGSIGTSITAAV